MFAKAFLKTFSLALLILVATGVARAQGAREILTNFPDAQAVVYVNSQRIFNEALPRVIPQTELDKMFADAQKQIGNFDVRSIHFVAVGVRFQEPISFQKPPDFILLAKGSFNVDALLSMARMATEGARTQETYKGRTIDVFNLAAMGKKPAQAGADSGKQGHAPPPFPIPEIAVVSLDANTVLIGVPSYVRAAVDAANGEGRVRADLLELVTRNPDNLLSFGGDIPPSLVNMLTAMGMPQNEEIKRVLSSLKQIQTAISMAGENFGIQSVIRTDTAESAQALNGMVTLGLGFAKMGIESELAKVPADKVGEREGIQAVMNLINSLTTTAQGNEVRMETAVPQQTVATFVQKEMERQKAAKAAQAAAAAKKPAAKPAPRGRRSRRRN